MVDKIQWFGQEENVHVKIVIIPLKPSDTCRQKSQCCCAVNQQSWDTFVFPECINGQLFASIFKYQLYNVKEQMSVLDTNTTH